MTLSPVIFCYYVEEGIEIFMLLADAPPENEVANGTSATDLPKHATL